jgi:phage FluMu protein Com
VTIQFHCPYCDKALKASDDKAGLRVKCPTCGNAITVEESPQAPVAEIDDDGLNESAFEPSPQSQPLAPVPLDPGEVIGTSWEIYKSQLGILIAAVVIATFLPLAISYMGSFVAAILGDVGGQVGRRNNMVRPGFTVASMMISFGTTLFVWFLQSFLGIGQAIVFLKVARGQPTEFGDLFRGGHYFLRALGSGFLFGLMIFFGVLLLIVPGIIAGLMFWPYLYVLVDTDAPGLDCLSRAREITRNTWGTMVVIWLAAMGIGMLGALACCVGTIFTTPLAFMLYTVAYCRMTGQPTARG